MKILVCDPIGQDGIDYLKNKGYELIVDQSMIADVDGLIVRGRTKVTKDVINSAKNLKVIARSGTGLDNIDLAVAKEKNISVVNAPGANAESVAEHTIGFMLALARNLVPTVTTLTSGVWAKSDFRGMELMGKTLGIIGMGHIGKRVAELGRAFGMHILEYVRGGALSDILTNSDFVSLHLPLTDLTRGLMGAREFSEMKKTAFFINTSRGAIVDETALVSALKSGTIAGAALDVYAIEPLPPESELLKLPNVLVTPHVAAVSREGENRVSREIAEKIDRILKGNHD